MVLRIIKNAFALAGVITVAYILFTFYIANNLHQHIQGTWINIENFTTEYTFTGNQYFINGVDMGTFRIRGNRITFSCGNSYHVIVRQRHNHMILDGMHYLRR